MNTFSVTLANLLGVSTQLAGLNPGLAGGVLVIGLAAKIAALVPSLTNSINDLQTDAASMPAAASALHAAVISIDAVKKSITPGSGVPSPSTTTLWTVMTNTTNLAISVAAVVAATTLAANCNPPTTQALSDFQQAYAAGNTGFAVTGVYDTATATAVGKTLGTTPPSCPVGVTPVSAPPTATGPAVPPASLVALAKIVVADSSICNENQANTNVYKFMTAFNVWAYPSPTLVPFAPSEYGQEVQFAIDAVLGNGSAPKCPPVAVVVPAAAPNNTMAIVGGVVAVGAVAALIYVMKHKTGLKNPIGDPFSVSAVRTGYVIQNADGYRTTAYEVYHEDKRVGRYHSWDAAIEAINHNMEREAYWPNIYYVDMDRRKTNLLNNFGKIIESRRVV